jgi:hypothetical protein|tara:strand:+ start:2175 stop:2360 length:186 start_codon:yes stop_codon:yes gene_type:complete
MTSVVGKLMQLGDGGDVDRTYDVAEKELVIGRYETLCFSRNAPLISPPRRGTTTRTPPRSD